MNQYIIKTSRKGAFGLLIGFGSALTVMVWKMLDQPKNIPFIGWGIAVLFTLVTVHYLFRTIRPKIFFKCDGNGVYLGNKEEFIEWEQVTDIHLGKLKVGRSNFFTPAVVITFEGTDFKTNGWFGANARYTTPSTFSFTAYNTNKVIDKICEYWFENKKKS